MVLANDGEACALDRAGVGGWRQACERGCTLRAPVRTREGRVGWPFRLCIC